MSKVSDRRLTDVEREARQRREAKAQADRIRLTRDIRMTFATPEGRNTLRAIMEICGYQKYDAVGDPGSGEIFMTSTMYNSARRSVYLRLREHVDTTTLIAVEHGTPNDVDLFS